MMKIGTDEFTFWLLALTNRYKKEKKKVHHAKLLQVLIQEETAYLHTIIL